MYQLLILNIESFLNFYPNVVRSKEPLIPPSDVAYEDYYHVFKPKKKTLIDLAMPDGSIVTSVLTRFRINDTSCSHRLDEFYFSKKLPVKPQEIFLGYSVSSPAKFRLLKIKKFDSYDIYKVTRENLDAPDYLIAIDPRDSTTVRRSSVNFRIVHIFKSSSRGWETLYSQDNSLCEGGC